VAEDQEQPGSGPDYTVAVVDRALELLELLGRFAPTSLAHLAGEAGCTRTAAFRLLRTLAARGFVVQEGARGLWRLGARFGAMRDAATEQGALAAHAAASLSALAEMTGEVAYFTERAGAEHRFTAISSSHPELPRYAALGSVGPLHAGIGRLLLAHAPDNIQTQVLSQRMARYTAATVTDPRRLSADLPRIRARGWLMTENEIEPGTICVAAPVRDARGDVVAALAIIGPLLRLKPPRSRQLLDPLLRIARRLSHELGWRSPAERRNPDTRR